jgi:hypothetical protein
MLARGFLSFDCFSPMKEELEMTKIFKLPHPYTSVIVIWIISDMITQFAIITFVT